MQKSVAKRLPTFRSDDQVYHADTCEPLVRAVTRGHVKLVALTRGQYPGRQLKTEQLSQVKSVGFWDATCSCDWGLDWHYNEGLELTFMETGDSAFGVDGRLYHLHANDLTITRPWQRHRVGDPHVNPCRLHWLILDLKVRRPNEAWQWPDWIILSRADRQRLTIILRQNEEAIWHAAPAVRACWRRIARAVEAHDVEPFDSRLAILINDLLLQMLNMFNHRDVQLDTRLSSSHRTVELFLNEIARSDDKLAYPWIVEEMAESCGLGRAQFTAICRQLTNLTPIQFLTRSRIDRAAQLLIDRPSMSVTEIGHSLGFSSSQYFSTVFRRQKELTPILWRGQGGQVASHLAQPGEK